MKSKKILTILLSLAIMFTFMPAMAFAAENDVTWAKDYSTVTVEKATGNVTFNTVREFQTSGQYEGMVKATADTSDYTGTLPTEKLTAYYYDLNNSEFGLSDTSMNHTALTGTYESYNTWAGKGQVRGLFFSAPSYVTNHTVTTKVYVSFQLPGGSGLYTLGDWGGSVKYTLDGEDYGYTALNSELQKASDDKTFSVWLDVDYNADANDKTPIYGSVQSKAVTVKGPVKGDPANALFYMDKITSTGGNANVARTAYDGAEHTVVVSDIKGYTVKWEVYNKTNGEWEAVDAVKVKDVNTSAVDAKALFYDDSITGTQTPVEKRVKVYIDKNDNAPYFAFDEDPAPAVGYFDVPAGEDYNPVDYVYVYPHSDGVATQKKAVAANEKELMAYFAEYAKFTTTTKKSTPNYEYVKFALNDDLTDAELKALDKKYEVLIKNLGLGENGGSIGTQTVSFYRTPATPDTEVEFTSAPSSKTYKGSKTTKKGKLKKTQSFTVKAVANNGYAVSYKLINANSKIKINKTSGKITLKKGLAKGTYKIKVKAYVVGHSTDPGWYETQAITIKVKK